MASNPFFTIIIPTYNRSYCIGIAIESVLGQSFDDWELIIVDDGSEDNTKSLVLQYSDSRICYFYKNHEERSAARNFGINLAKGRFVCFLDSDDEYLSDFLHLLHTAIHQNPDFKIFRTGTIMRKYGKNVTLPNFPIDTKSTFESICHNFNGFGSYCFNKELFLKNIFDTRFSVAQDFHLVARLSRENSILYINGYGFLMHYNEKSELRLSNNLNRMQNKILCFKDILHIMHLSKTEKRMIYERIAIVQGIIIQTFVTSFQAKYFIPSLRGIYFIGAHLYSSFSAYKRIKNL